MSVGFLLEVDQPIVFFWLEKVVGFTYTGFYGVLRWFWLFAVVLMFVCFAKGECGGG